MSKFEAPGVHRWAGDSWNIVSMLVRFRMTTGNQITRWNLLDQIDSPSAQHSLSQIWMLRLCKVSASRRDAAEESLLFHSGLPKGWCMKVGGRMLNGIHAYVSFFLHILGSYESVSSEASREKVDVRSIIQAAMLAHRRRRCSSCMDWVSSSVRLILVVTRLTWPRK